MDFKYILYTIVEDAESMDWSAVIRMAQWSFQVSYASNKMAPQCVGRLIN